MYTFKSMSIDTFHLYFTNNLCSWDCNSILLMWP